jgi:hypothetical protein
MAKKRAPEDCGDFSPEMYNTEDVVFEMPNGKRRNVVTLIARSGTDFNLVKYYLSLKEFVDKIEQQLNIMESTGEEQ